MTAEQNEGYVKGLLDHKAFLEVRAAAAEDTAKKTDNPVVKVRNEVEAKELRSRVSLVEAELKKFHHDAKPASKRAAKRA